MSAVMEINKNMVAFSNPGEIDPRVWSTFGVSVKETDSAIGQFGTGLKYAIAVLMRHGRSFWIESKGRRYEFGVTKSDIRGKEFDQITCNGEILPFTTHLGANWELWQAYREIFSNCLDEGGRLGDEGDTVIYAELSDIDHGDVFLNKSRTLVASSSYCDVYAGSSGYIYFRGIRAQTLTKHSFFTYNIKIAELTEDRTFKYQVDLHKAIGEVVLENPDSDFARSFLFESKDSFEQNIDFDCAGRQPSGRILELVGKHRRDNIYMQESLVDKAIRQLGATIFEKQEADPRQERVINKAKDFCSRIGHEIKHPVFVSTNLGGATLALANKKDMTIYLSDTVLDQGVKQVAATLIEENLHLSKGFSDLTYEMQSYLFDQIVTMGERLTGEIL